MSLPLDPLALPLRGSRLIEASAGTGKTWAIAALYVRLVLGHGSEATRFVEPLPPSRILVMTFTIAATRELVDRVRDRLLDAARAFRGDATAIDPFLARLVADYATAADREHAAWRLAMAADAMDDATVLTIDAWVQKVLREHAFDSGSPLDETLEPDAEAMLVDAARDWWRQEVYPLSPGAAARVARQWVDVDALVADIRRWLAKLDDEEDEAEEGTLARLLAAADDAAVDASLKSAWAARLPTMRDALLAGLGAKKPYAAVKKPTQKAAKAVFADLLAWATTPGSATLGHDEATLATIGRSALSRQLDDATAATLPAEFAAFDALLDVLFPTAAMRLCAARGVRRRMRALKERAGLFGFADQTDRLDRALAGPGGAALRARIVEQYPVALIDEFQDTSPVQYRIFDRVYRTAADDLSTALLLIGDPKQSIYGFRGADIQSYLRARRATTGRQHWLTTNYRSTKPLVAAVNRLFEAAETDDDAAPDDAGAFRFGPRTRSPLPFVPVAARGCDETLVTGGADVPALTIVHDAESTANADTLKRLAERCAEWIATMLADRQAGFVGAGGVRERPRMLAPSDIAVLVRTGTEAFAIRRALRRRRIASAYLSEGRSVFGTDEAADLSRWLAACAEPFDGRLARAALATKLAGLSLAELDALSRDDAAFEARVELFERLNVAWRQQGVLAAIHRTLHAMDLPARWLSSPDADGERRLTNVLHLAELLQAASARIDGLEALIRWLDVQRGTVGAEVDAEVVRLESDDALIRVITIHKAKGLEFPIVCLPFASTFREVDDDYAWLPDRDGRRRVVLRLDADDRAAVARERKQEDLRLLYVALTRAEHALWLGVSPPRAHRGRGCAFHRSALGYLLVGDRPVAEPAIAAALHARFDGVDGVAIVAADGEPGVTTVAARDDRPPLVEPPRYTASFERDWAIGSFSSLVRDLPRLPFVIAPVDPAVEEELLGGPLDEDDDGDGERSSLPVATAARHRFPRGAAAGNVVHDQLEWLAAERFVFDDERKAALVQRVRRLGWEGRGDDLATWLDEVTTTPLPPLGVALRDLARILPEMEFWFPAESIDAATIDALCRAHLLDGRDRPPLPARRLHGMLMGFTDLVFEHDGRYWIVDYKSNALGPADDDYDDEAIARSMAEHRYDVQGAIYLVALHRLLRARLGDAYDPDRHLGGALYLYLRGIAGPVRGCHVLPARRALLDALDAAFDGVAVA